MEILSFKTNINSTSCIATVMPFFEAEQSIRYWKVDTASLHKVLVVSGHAVDPQLVINLVQRAGFRAEFIRIYSTGGPDV